MHRLYEDYWRMPEREREERWLLRGTLLCLVTAAVLYIIGFSTLLYMGKPLPNCFAVAKAGILCTSNHHG